MAISSSNQSYEEMSEGVGLDPKVKNDGAINSISDEKSKIEYDEDVIVTPDRERADSHWFRASFMVSDTQRRLYLYTTSFQFYILAPFLALLVTVSLHWKYANFSRNLIGSRASACSCVQTNVFYQPRDCLHENVYFVVDSPDVYKKMECFNCTTKPDFGNLPTYFEWLANDNFFEYAPVVAAVLNFYAIYVVYASLSLLGGSEHIMRGFACDRGRGSLALATIPYTRIDFNCFSSSQYTLLITGPAMRYGFLNLGMLVTLVMFAVRYDYRGQCISITKRAEVKWYASWCVGYLFVFGTGTAVLLSQHCRYSRGIEYFHKKVFPYYRPMLGYESSVIRGALVLILSTLYATLVFASQIVAVLVTLLACVPVGIFCLLRFRCTKTCWRAMREKTYGNLQIFRRKLLYPSFAMGCLTVTTHVPRIDKDVSEPHWFYH